MIALLVAAFGLAACDSMMGVGSEGDGSARLTVRMIDAPFPFELVDQVNVTLSRVDVHSEANGSVTIMEDPEEFNLLDLQNGVFAELGDVTVDPGVYDEVRLYVDDATIVLTDGTEHDIKVPSGRIKVLTNGLTVNEGEDVTLTIDFDVSKSFVVKGNPNTPAGIKGFIFKPTVVPAGVERKRHKGDDDDENEVKGPIEEVTETYVQVGGVQYFFGEDTEFDDIDRASLEPGMNVEIHFTEAEDGTLVITKIEAKDEDDDDGDNDEGEDDDGEELEAEGTITLLGADFIEVDGVQYVVTDETEFDDTSFESLEEGMYVEIEYVETETGTFEAVKVEVEDGDEEDDGEELEAEGTITLLGADFIEVDGVQYVVTDETEFDDTSFENLEEGMYVEIEYVETETGTFEAVKVEVEEADEEGNEEAEDDEEEEEDETEEEDEDDGEDV